MKSVLRDRALSIALAVLSVVAVAAIIGPWIWDKPVNATGSSLLDSRLAPSWTHPFGTDQSGRDVLARFLSGARISLLAGVISVAAGGLIGGALGVISGARRGWFDTALMRVLDIVLAFPPLILAMGIATARGPGVTSAVIGIVLTTIPYFTRLVRSDVVKINALPHVESSRAMGASERRTLLRHVVPHTASTMLVQSASVFGYTVLSLAALGFVGLGADANTPEWGVMITKGQGEMLNGNWWMATFPGIGLLIVCTAANVVADRVRVHLHSPAEADPDLPGTIPTISPIGVGG